MTLKTMLTILNHKRQLRLVLDIINMLRKFSDCPRLEFKKNILEFFNKKETIFQNCIQQLKLL